jgi:hypothetical protein
MLNPVDQQALLVGVLQVGARFTSSRLATSWGGAEGGAAAARPAKSKPKLGMRSLSFMVNPFFFFIETNE